MAINEREQARNIANVWLAKGDNFGALDPDGNECIVARSYMRALEKIERLTDIINRATFDRDLITAELADEWPKAIQP